MTTTITVETHDWPVSVTLHDDHYHADDRIEISRNGYERQFVPAHSKAQFHITSTRSISVHELPKEATGLNNPPKGPAGLGNIAWGAQPEPTEPGDEVAGDGA